MPKNKNVINILCGLSLLTLSTTTSAMQNNKNDFIKINENFNQQALNQTSKTLNKSYSKEINNDFEKIDNSIKLNKTFDEKLKNKNIDEKSLNEANKPKKNLNLKIEQEKLNNLFKNKKNFRNQTINQKPKKINKDYFIKVDNVFEKIKDYRKYNKTPNKKTKELKNIDVFREERINIYKNYFLKILKQITNSKINDFEKNLKTIIQKYENTLKEYKNIFQDNYKINQEIKNIILEIEKQIFLKILKQIENLNLNIINFPEKTEKFENNYVKIITQYTNRLKECKKNIAEDYKTKKELKNIILNIENEFKNYRFNFRKNIANSLKNNLEKDIFKKNNFSDKETILNDYCKNQYQNTIKTLDHIIKEAEILDENISKKDLTAENINEKIKQYNETREKIKNFEFYNETINYLYNIIEFQYGGFEKNDLYEKFMDSYSNTINTKHTLQNLENAIFEIIENNIYNDEKISNIININPKIFNMSDYDEIKEEYEELKNLFAEKNINIENINKNNLTELIQKKVHGLISKKIENHIDKILNDIKKTIYDIKKQTTIKNFNDINIIYNTLDNEFEKFKREIKFHPYDIKQEYEKLKQTLVEQNINIENINTDNIKELKLIEEKANKLKCKRIKSYIEKIKTNEKILDNINKIISGIKKQTTTKNVNDMAFICNLLENKFNKFENIIKKYPDDIVYIEELKNYMQKTKEKFNSLLQSISITKLKSDLKEEKIENKKNKSNTTSTPKASKFLEFFKIDNIKNEKNSLNRSLTPKQLKLFEGKKYNLKENLEKEKILNEQQKFFEEKKEHLKEKVLIENDIIHYYRGIILGYSDKIEQYLKDFDLLELKNFIPKDDIEKENYDEEKIKILKTKLDLKNDHFKKHMFDLNKKLNGKNFSIRDFILDINTKFNRDYRNLNNKFGIILSNIKNYLETKNK